MTPDTGLHFHDVVVLLEPIGRVATVFELQPAWRRSGTDASITGGASGQQRQAGLVIRVTCESAHTQAQVREQKGGPHCRSEGYIAFVEGTHERSSDIRGQN